METLGSICRMLRPKDWMTSIDLQDAFLHVGIHPHSRKYLHFKWGGETVPVQDPPIQSLSLPIRFHQDRSPTVAMGQREGHMTFSIPGQPSHCSGEQGGSNPTHTDGPRANVATRIFGK